MKIEGGNYQPECIFSVYWQHASCYYEMGKPEVCKNRINRLVRLGIGPTLDDLQARNFAINRQPCFHTHELINK